MDLLRELAQEAVQKWEALSQDEQMDVALELIPDVEQVPCHARLSGAGSHSLPLPLVCYRCGTCS